MAKQVDYRLQTLLDLRERKKEEAERVLGEAMQALKAEQERQREMEEELERMIAKRQARMREYTEKTMRGEMSAQNAVSARLFIDRLKEQEEAQKSAIEGQRAVVAQKEDEVRAAREQLVLATQELKALEKHKEKWTEQLKKEELAKQEEALDEIAQTIFLNRER